MSDKKLDKILQVAEGTRTSVQSLDLRVDGLAVNQEKMLSNAKSLEMRVDGLTTTVDTLAVNQDKILSKVQSLELGAENLTTTVGTLATNQDKILVKVLEVDARLYTFVTKEDLMVSTEQVVTTIDRFAKLHETLDQELVAMRNKYDRLEERLEVVESKLKLQST